MSDCASDATAGEGSGLAVHITAGEVWLKFTPLTGPRGMLNLEALIDACGDLLMRPDVRTSIEVWCRERRVARAMDLMMDSDGDLPGTSF